MCSRPLVVVCMVMALTVANPVPLETTTARSGQQMGETIKQVSHQLMEINATSPDIFTLDTRTPPKIKQKKKIKPMTASEPSPIMMMESSHAGVAIPVDADDLVIEETTKKLNFYKVEKPTTNSGLSTWILLSGQQASSTMKPTRKPIIKPTENINTTLVVEPNKIIKPIFKKRVTTTTSTTAKSPTSTSTTQSTLESSPSSITTHKPTTKLTKVKASLLANANKKFTTTTEVSSAPTKKIVTTTSKPPSTLTAKIIKTTTPSPTNLTISSNSTITSSSTLPAEAKDVETELDDKKTRRPSTNKKKKNKNRRRRPAEKNDSITSNSTKVAKHKIKEKPIGTQLYSYLSREVMPTVGVGLVGLVVTAGLASYFLYPFGIARRSYEVDRKDKEGTYYYNNDYSGGIAEEEAIGKVIAGMPSNSLYGNTYKTPTTRHRNRQVDHRIAPSYDYQPVSYPSQDVIEQNKEAGYSVDDQQFVVGNTPKAEEATPAAVPEHGPRSLRLRRQIPDESENEIDGGGITSTILPETTFEPPTTTEDNFTAGPVPNQFNSYFKLFQDLFKLKINLGLQLLQNATQAVSKYVSRVQQRFDEHNRNDTQTY